MMSHDQKIVLCNSSSIAERNLMFVGPISTKLHRGWSGLQNHASGRAAARSSHRIYVDLREATDQPPAMAPRTMSGSRAVTMASGKGMSVGWCERSSSQAK